jgi:predicted nucleic acid-binding protein
MIEAPRYVLDTTVAAKWYLHDEQLVSNALHVRDAFIEGQIRFIAPTQITHELASTFLRATWPSAPRIRLSEAQAEAFLADFQSFQIEFIQADVLIPMAFRLARYYTCSYWDGLYLATAQMTNSQLIHADKNLRGALRGRFPLELWIEDYQTPVE